MPRKQPAHEVARNGVAEARTLARRSYDHARAGAAGTSGVLLDRWWSETLTATAGQRPDTAREMFERTRLLIELYSDRQSWPR